MAEKKRHRPPDDKEQSKMFIEKARELGADDDDECVADDLMGRLAKMPPEPHKKKRDQRR